MAAMLGILAGMSSAVTTIGAGFSGLGALVSKVWNTISTAFSDYIIEPIEDFFDWFEGVWDDLSGWADEAFDFTTPAILTSDYWTGSEGIFTKIEEGFINFKTGAKIAFDILMPDVFTKGYWFGEGGVFTWPVMPWESWGDFSVPEWLTWDYYFGSSVFVWPDMPWDSWGDFTLPAWLTWDYYFGEGGAFDFDIKWGEIFSFEPGGIFTSDYWFGNGGVFDWTMPWENWSFSWSDFLPDWSWSDVIPESLGDLFSIDGDITQTIANGFSGALDAFKILVNANLINPINSVMNYDLPLIGSLTSITGLGNIPLLAKGGIVNKPTLAMIGEDGPEAVVPLNQRNNPGGAGMGGTVNVTVNASGITDRSDKRALAREIGNMIQNELARNIGGTTMRGR